MGNGLSAIQTHLLNMLAWFDGFAKDNKLSYYILGGTVLGAMRHGGFIPWDDDIDIGLPRSDYERLQRIMADYEGVYMLETPSSPAKDYRYAMSKLYDTTTTLVERMHPPCKRGVYIDIFPLDGIGDTPEEYRRRYRPIHRLNMLLAMRKCSPRKTRAFYKNVGIVLSRAIPEVLLSTKKLGQRIDVLCGSIDFDESEYVGNLLGSYGYREIVPRSVFGTPTRYAFEDIEVFGPEQAECYLEHIYNDWRTLPPEDKRGIQHDFLHIDLNKSYLDE